MFLGLGFHRGKSFKLDCNFFPVRSRKFLSPSAITKEIMEMEMEKVFFVFEVLGFIKSNINHPSKCIYRN